MTKLDEVLLTMVDGLPRVPKQYELHCHPSVHLALTQLAMDEPVNPWSPPPQPPSPMYGECAIIVSDGFSHGEWELRENGATIKRGQLGEPS